MNLQDILGEREFVVDLDYKIEQTKTKTGLTVEFNKKDLNKIKRALKLTDRYLTKMKKSGFEESNANINIKEK